MPFQDTTSIISGLNQQITDWPLGDDRVFTGAVSGLLAPITAAYFTLKLNPNDIDANAILQLRVTTANSLHGYVTQPATLNFHVFSSDYEGLVSAGPLYWWDFRVICSDNSTVTAATGQVAFQQNVTQTNVGGTASALANGGLPRWRGFTAQNPQSLSAGIFNVGDIFFNSAAGINQPVGWRCIGQGSPGVWIALGQITGQGIGPAGPPGPAGSPGLSGWFPAPPWFLSATVPSTGTHVFGEIAWNTNPVAGGNIAWVCLIGGTPGIWYALGPIDLLPS